MVLALRDREVVQDLFLDLYFELKYINLLCNVFKEAKILSKSWF